MDVAVQRIKELVDAAGTTVRELAEIAGCSKSAMQRYISGERDIPTNILNGIAEAFKVHPAYLLGWVNDRNYIPQISSQPAGSELSERKKEFIKKVAEMSDEQLDRLEQILSLVETTGQ